MGEEREEIKRFTAKKKADIVMDILQGKTTVTEVSRQYDLTPALIKEMLSNCYCTYVCVTVSFSNITIVIILVRRFFYKKAPFMLKW